MKKCSKCGIQNSQYLSEEKFVIIDDESLCPYCANIINNKNVNDSKQIQSVTVENSLLGELLQISGYLVLIVGVIVGIILLITTPIIGAIVLFITIVSGLLLIGVSEIIFLLNESLNKQQNG